VYHSFLHLSRLGRVSLHIGVFQDRPATRSVAHPLQLSKSVARPELRRRRVGQLLAPTHSSARSGISPSVAESRHDAPPSHLYPTPQPDHAWPTMPVPLPQRQIQGCLLKIVRDRLTAFSTSRVPPQFGCTIFSVCTRRTIGSPTALHFCPSGVKGDIYSSYINVGSS